MSDYIYHIGNDYDCINKEYVILRDAMMLITKPEMTDSEKEKAVGKD